MRSGAPPGRTLGAAVLALGALLGVVGAVLPWSRQVEALPPVAGRSAEPTFTQLGVQLVNGWLVVVAAALLAVLAVFLLVRPRTWVPWASLAPLALGGGSIGYWSAALAHGGLDVPAGVLLALVGLAVAGLGAGVGREARPAGRLTVAALALIVLGVAALVGIGIFQIAPIQMRVF